MQARNRNVQVDFPLHPGALNVQIPPEPFGHLARLLLQRALQQLAAGDLRSLSRVRAWFVEPEDYAERSIELIDAD